MDASATLCGAAEAEKRWYEVLKEEVLELRWRVLVVACFLTFGSYYIFDFPGSIGTGEGATIEQRFKTHGKEYTQKMNQLLYSVYSWPNTVLAVFGGVLIDKFLGIRKAMLLFTFCILLGASFFWLGVYYVVYPLMLIARVVFGLGGESLSVAQSAYVARWFKHSRGMALAFGITISFSRVGSSFNFLFSPMIAEARGVEVAALFGILSCVVSFCACIILVFADVHAVRTGYIRQEPREAGSGVMKLTDAVRLPFAFWALTIICVFCYSAIFPFIGLGVNFFEVKYEYTTRTASNYISAYQFASAAGSPLVGLVVDNVGRNTLWLIAASASFLLIHLLLLTTMIPGIVMMIIMGVSYSVLVSGLWPSVPWAVGENVLGLSYGVIMAVQNVGLALFPIIVGSILDRYVPDTTGKGAAADSSSSQASADDVRPLPTLKGYQMAEMVFIAAATVSLLASVVLLVSDVRHGGALTASNTRRKEMAAEKRAALLESLPDEERALMFAQHDS
ncbi:putative major facilitator superfamily [Trypanosoma conorhini]|uniref:Lysosomal dipeptide transporter MFSD1 n=1 Tax=Trypanosoma conorhini TaxID=83891 RepID=A0A422PBE5_9TRYP|nr:putative major facilitator superfamily [Trypanosoma conorhini]RNF15034.1 putative major facilitator superfamily [Trypanosoma conorhini]